MLDRFRTFFKKYERYVSPVTLACGFTFDNLTLRQIDVFYSNFVLISYLFVSASSIMLLNIHESRRLTRGQEKRSETIHAVSVFMMQFCLGGLFSASFLFYSRSGSIIESWPFLLMIVGYIAGNEILRKNYIQLTFQISVFFTALFSYLIFFLPVVLGKMNDSIFLLSGISALMITGVFIYILSWFAPKQVGQSAPTLLLAVGGLFALINALYFTNLIPPIPLALKQEGIYSSVTKLADGTYQTVAENQPSTLLPSGIFGLFAPTPTIHVAAGASLYALSAVFAPADLTTDIVHQWQEYNGDTKQWVTVATIDLGISGGRRNGFRTFSEEGNIYPGLWRVNVQTPRGQLLGRLSFNVAVPTGAEAFTTVTQ